MLPGGCGGRCPTGGRGDSLPRRERVRGNTALQVIGVSPAEKAQSVSLIVFDGAVRAYHLSLGIEHYNACEELRPVRAGIEKILFPLCFRLRY